MGIVRTLADEASHVDYFTIIAVERVSGRQQFQTSARTPEEVSGTMETMVKGNLPKFFSHFLVIGTREGREPQLRQWSMD